MLYMDENNHELGEEAEFYSAIRVKKNSTNEYERVPQGSSFLSKAHYPKNPLVFAYEKKLARLMLLVSCLHNQRW